jgi:acyl-coenzyme A synthetase/AMP-(fatty) acid ligase
MFLDATLPDALISHMLNDARPVVILTRGRAQFRDLPTLDVLALPEKMAAREPPHWLDDPAQRLATIFYTSGTTGMPKGVECTHAGYVNLALSYADYLDLIPGMDATSLTSSLGYDGSMSEMYSAWVSGCAVVMLTKEQIRSGPDLVPLLRESEVTVLFLPAGAADYAHGIPRNGSPLSLVPLHRSGGRSISQYARGALDAGPTPDHQHLWPY